MGKTLPCLAGTAVFLATAAAGAPPGPPQGLPATQQVLVLDAPFSRFGHLTIRRDDPSVMYWVVDGVGVLKSTDGGQSWQPKNNGLPNLATRYLAIHPQDPDHLMVGFLGHFTAQGDRPYRSLDGGERWEPTVICEREDGQINLRQQCDAARLLFDPTAPDRFYYLVISQRDLCGGFYRSCDLGASYDRNPWCLPAGEPRPSCAAADPEPVNNFASNDATILEVHPVTGDLFGTTGLHSSESALMTSRDKGGRWTYEDVADTTNTFLSAGDQGRTSLFLRDFVLAPSNPQVRYGAFEGPRCTDGRAHPMGFLCPYPHALVSQPPLVARWFGELSGGTDCAGANDCDGDPTPDRVWRPIFDGSTRPGGLSVRAMLVHPTDPDRLFVAGVSGPPGTDELLMLTPAASADPQAAPWRVTTLVQGIDGLPSLVQDPAAADRFYLVDRTTIRRFASTDGWLSWQSATVADLGGVFHVYDLVETRGSAGPRIAAATSTALWVGDELGLAWTTPDVFTMQAASRLAVAPSDPDRVFAKRTWALTMGTGGFDQMTDVDHVYERRRVMCTNLFHQVAADPDNPSMVYAATGAGIWNHPDIHVPVNQADMDATSRAWAPLARRANGLDDEYTWSVAFDPSDAAHNRILAGSRSGAIYESLDRGLSWSPASMSVPANVAPLLRDVRDIQFAPPRAYAATAAGVLARETPSQPWRISLAGDRVVRISPGATGALRVYAAGDAGVYRSGDGGVSWEPLSLLAAPPYSAVLETKSRDGRHHLWVPDFHAGLYRVSTTLSARPGVGPQQVVLDWTEDPDLPPVPGYELHYGSDPDRMDGRDAAEGRSPIPLGPVTTTTLTGLSFTSGPVYVALRALGDQPRRGPMGLPLEVRFGYVFSPRVTASDSSSCPPAIRLEWEPVPGALGYTVHRAGASPGGPFVPVATLGPQATSFEDSPVAAETMYWYFLSTAYPGAQTSGGNIASVAARDDSDLDGAANCADTCPADFDPDQRDTDGDGDGDVCDPDDDADGLPDSADNCPLRANPDQPDADGDGVGDACDNCPDQPNPAASPGAAQADDADGDGRGAPCDCAPLDASAFALPPEITGFTFAQDAVTLQWDPAAAAAGAGTLYDVVSGSPAELPPGSGLSEICLASGSPAAVAADLSSPPPGAGRYYLVRGRNVCGAGTYGIGSGPVERSTPACP